MSPLYEAAVHSSNEPQEQAKSSNTLPCILILAMRESPTQLRMTLPEGEDAKVVAASHAHPGDDQGLR